MNWNTFIASSLFAVVNLFGTMAHAEATQKPDIQRVLSIEDDGGVSCEVVNARMTYLDSAGETRVLAYRRFAQHCSEGS